MNNFTLIITIFFCIATYFAPREKFLWPLVASACLLPGSQEILIFNLNFKIIRIIFFCGLLRIIIRHEIITIKWNYFDKLVFAWCIVGSFVYILQYGNFIAVIRKLGVLCDSLGLYWIFRQGIRNWDDVYDLIKVFAVSALLLAPIVIVERIHQQPIVYSIFGFTGTEYHRGRFRCAGPFMSPIMMGCFWAALLPVFFSMFEIKKNFLYIFSMLASAILVILSASSTPLLISVVIIFFWFFRSFWRYNNIIFLAAIASLILLSIIMKAPVWHLISRVNIFSGSTGWHRFFLFDEFINNVSDWFWLGTKSTENWGRGLGDITNQFVLEAVRGGFITMALFSLVIYSSIKITGNYFLYDSGMSGGCFSWGLCVSIFGHFAAFWAVSYFGQIMLLIYMTFAIVGFVQAQPQEN